MARDAKVRRMAAVAAVIAVTVVVMAAGEAVAAVRIETGLREAKDLRPQVQYGMTLAGRVAEAIGGLRLPRIYGKGGWGEAPAGGDARIARIARR